MLPGQRAVEGILSDSIVYGTEIYADRMAQISEAVKGTDRKGQFFDRLLNGKVPRGFVEPLGEGMWAGNCLAAQAGHVAATRSRRLSAAARQAGASRLIAAGLDLSAGAIDLPNIEADFLRLRAFTIAHVEDRAVLQALNENLQTILNGGGSYTDFRGKIDELLGNTLSDFHIETVFRTNLQTALNSGKYYEGMDAIAELPYWQYKTAGDERVRPAHALLDGLVWRKDNPVWDEIYPPNGFNCRCTVLEWDAASLQKAGLTPQSWGITKEQQPDAGFANNAAMDVRVLSQLCRLYDFVMATPDAYGLGELGIHPPVAPPQAGGQALRDDSGKVREISDSVWNSVLIGDRQIVADTLRDPQEIWGWPGKPLNYIAMWETPAGTRTVCIKVWGTVQSIEVVSGTAEQFRVGMLIKG